MSEIERLYNNRKGEEAPQPALKICVQHVENPGLIFEKISNVIEGIIKYETEGKVSLDSERYFPEWLITSFTENYTGRSPQQFPYYYENWIEAINNRGWRWWSVGVGKSDLTFQLLATGLPYMIDPFFFVLSAQHVNLKLILFSELGRPFKKLNIS